MKFIKCLMCLSFDTSNRVRKEFCSFQNHEDFYIEFCPLYFFLFNNYSSSIDGAMRPTYWIEIWNSIFNPFLYIACINNDIEGWHNQFRGFRFFQWKNWIFADKLIKKQELIEIKFRRLMDSDILLTKILSRHIF